VCSAPAQNACGGCTTLANNVGDPCTVSGCASTYQCSSTSLACKDIAPTNLGASCGSCGGVVTCSGGCSIATPANYGTSCGVLNCGACAGSVPKQYNCSGVCAPIDTCSGAAALMATTICP
jgi:hypothetical protein